MKTFAQLCVCFAALLFCSGCATKALWEDGNFARFHEPATPSNLQLFESAKEQKILVVYDEGNDETNAKRRRAYWADASRIQPENPYRPDFVSPKTAKRLLSMRIVTTPESIGYSAIVTNDAHAFFLFKDASSIALFDLPVYEDASGRTKQIALTPVTVVADLTVIGGLLFLWAWAGGFSGTF